MHTAVLLAIILAVIVVTVYRLKGIDRRHELMSRSPKPDGDGAAAHTGRDDGL